MSKPVPLAVLPPVPSARPAVRAWRWAVEVLTHHLALHLPPIQAARCAARARGLGAVAELPGLDAGGVVEATAAPSA